MITDRKILRYLQAILLTLFITIAYTAANTPKTVPKQSRNALKQESETGYTTQLFRVTGFCQGKCCCGKWSDGITASGHIIKTGDKFVAAPPGYSFGTMVEIPGYGKVPVLDRGGAIKGNRLDCYFDTHQEALNWGVKMLKVRIL